MIIEKCCVCKNKHPIAMCLALKLDDELGDILGFSDKILSYDFCLDCGSKFLQYLIENKRKRKVEKK